MTRLPYPDLLDEISGVSVPDYIASITRLLTLDYRRILTCHGTTFDWPRQHAIARAQIGSKG